MDSRLPIEKRDILLFRYLDGNIPYSHLKNFIYFLSGVQVKAGLSFSYGDAAGALIPNLTLRENIQLDLFWNCFEDKNFCLEQFLCKHDNRHLDAFFRRITLLDEYPHKVDDRTRKMTALLKTLLRPSLYLFLESPEQYLHPEDGEIFFKAVDCQRWKSGLTVLIYSEQIELLREYVNKDVYCSENQKFVVKSRQVSTSLVVKQRDRRVLQDGEGRIEFTFGRSSKKKIAA